MNIVLPLFFLAVGIGLFARRMNPILWAVVGVGIILVLAKQYITAP